MTARTELLDGGSATDTGHRVQRRRSVSLATAVATLAREKLRAAVRSGDLMMAALSPVVFFLCFYLPLHRRFELSGASYAQFLLPIILLQSALFTAIAATEAAGADARAGVRERLASLPMSRTSAPVARMVWVVVRMSVAVIAGLVIGSAFGFRFHGSIWQTTLFIVVLILAGLAVSMLTDAVGSSVRNSTSIAHVLMIPQLILIMASTGLVPAGGFPGWVQPFVRNQPLSVLADALRDLAAGDPAAAAAPALWLLGLLLAGWMAMVCAGRTQVGR